MHFEALPPQGGSKVRGNLDKTLLSPIGNQYTVSLCQDLPGTIVFKFNKFSIENFLSGFFIYELHYVTNFLSGFVRISNNHEQ
jgi:hypothetical protein